MRFIDTLKHELYGERWFPSRKMMNSLLKKALKILKVPCKVKIIYETNKKLTYEITSIYRRKENTIEIYVNGFYKPMERKELLYLLVHELSHGLDEREGEYEGKFPAIIGHEYFLRFTDMVFNTYTDYVTTLNLTRRIGKEKAIEIATYKDEEYIELANNFFELVRKRGGMVSKDAVFEIFFFGYIPALSNYFTVYAVRKALGLNLPSNMLEAPRKLSAKVFEDISYLYGLKKRENRTWFWIGLNLNITALFVQIISLKDLAEGRIVPLRICKVLEVVEKIRENFKLSREIVEKWKKFLAVEK